MKNIKQITIYFILFWWATTSFAQGNKSEVVFQSGFEEQPNTIHLKLFNPLVLYDEGIVVYRREANSSQWEKLTDKPILKGDYIIPAHILSADEQLAEAVEIARHLTADALEDIVKAQVVVEMCRSNEFAKFIGTYFSDPTAVAGLTYRYMIKRIYKGNEIFDVVTKPIRSGEYVPVDPPKEFTVNAKNRKAKLRWMVETSRYFGVNIYRKQEDVAAVTKLNEKPVMVSKVPMPDGSWRYPEEFYMDRGIKNYIRYEYFIKGIDFFGFETLPSDVVEVVSKNTIPPPAPSMLLSGVKDYVISLKWTMPDSIKAQGLNIYRSPSMNTPFKKVNSELLPLTTTTFEERIEQPGFYYYYVATIGADSLEGKSNYTMTEIKDVVPPPIPVNLYAEADTACIRLSWDPVTDNDLMGYR
ncbi:MAG: hypothetical protein MI922_20690, partial [Bacteroidales bacterium]|nr:hypothetical protein [Bacteroidales bacterium]